MKSTMTDRQVAILNVFHSIMSEFWQEYRNPVVLRPDHTRDQLETLLKQRVIDKWFRFAEFGVTCRADINGMSLKIKDRVRATHSETALRSSVDVSFFGTKLCAT